MIKRLLISIVACAFAGASMAANQVFINGDESGQGFIAKHLNQCFFVSPEHVVKNSMFLDLVGSNKQKSLGEGQTIQTFGYDLAVGSVGGELARRCDTQYLSLKKNSDKIEQTNLVSVSSVNPDGLISRIQATAVEISLTYISIKPTSTAQSLYKGLSGSLVFSDETPIGMLQSVDGLTGVGKVLRFDRLLETISPFFGTSSSFAVQTTAKDVKKTVPTASKGLAYQIDSWSIATNSSDTSPSLIMDDDPSTAWHTSLNGQILEFVLVLARSTEVSGLRYTSDIDGKASVKTVEVLASRRASGKRGWLSLASYSGLPTKVDNTIGWSPTKVKRIRVRIYDSWLADGSIDINELVLF